MSEHPGSALAVSYHVLKGRDVVRGEPLFLIVRPEVGRDLHHAICGIEFPQTHLVAHCGGQHELIQRRRFLGGESLKLELIGLSLYEAKTDVHVGPVLELFAEHPNREGFLSVLDRHHASGRMEIIVDRRLLGSIAAHETLSLHSVKSTVFQF